MCKYAFYLYQNTKTVIVYGSWNFLFSCHLVITTSTICLSSAWLFAIVDVT